MSKIWKLFLALLLIFAFIGVAYGATSTCTPCQQKQKNQGAATQPSTPAATSTTAVGEQKVFDKGYLPMILISGVGAAMNPCIIGVILMLAGYSVIFLKKPRLALEIGLIFILTITLLYFFLGIGFYKAIILLKSLGNFTIVYQIVRYIIAALLIFMGFIGIKDMLLPNVGFSFKLPEKFVRPILEKSSISILATIIAALIIGLFGLPCSLAIYAGALNILPTNLSNFSIIFYLLVFALAFTIPLILFLLLVYFSKKLVSLKENQEKFDRYLRGIIGILLLIFGIILLIR